MPALVRLGEVLVEEQVAQLSMLDDGATWARTPDGVRRGLTAVELHASRTGASVRLTGGLQLTRLTAFAQQAWLELATMRFSEGRVLGDCAIGRGYLRFALGEFELDYTGIGLRAHLYPIVTIHPTGPISVSFRLIGSGAPVPAGEFVHTYVNLPFHEADAVRVPPALARLAPDIAVRYNRPAEAGSTQELQREHERALSQLTTVVESGDFKFELAPLSMDKPDTLQSVAHTVFGCVGYLLGRERTPRWRRTISGWAPAALGSYWCARPHVYLLNFDEQMESPKMNEERHGHRFGEILSRMHGKDGRRYLGPNLRHGDDYGAYFASSASLRAWAAPRDGGGRPRDPNDNDRVLEEQVKVEFVEYVHMLHRRLLESVESEPRAATVLAARRDMIRLEHALAEATPYGELREFFEAAWTALGLQPLCARVGASLAIREAEATLTESRKSEAFGTAMTLVFGVLAVPALATEVLAPLVRLLGLTLPTNEDEAKLLLLAVSLLLVCAPLAWLYRRTRV